MERAPGESDLADWTARPSPTAVAHDTNEAVAYDSAAKRSGVSPRSHSSTRLEDALKIVLLLCSLVALRLA
jgi:hypothetical protein